MAKAFLAAWMLFGGMCVDAYSQPRSLQDGLLHQQAVTTAAASVHGLLDSSDARADLLGGLVRLAFHDAGTFDGVSGGADGCVDLSWNENGGLAPIIDQLAPIVSAAAGQLSRADVWALAGNVAVEFAGGPQLEFESGRVDAAGCIGHGLRLPDAEQGHIHVRDIFVTRLGFAEREVVHSWVRMCLAELSVPIQATMVHGFSGTTSLQMHFSRTLFACLGASGSNQIFRVSLGLSGMDVGRR